MRRKLSERRRRRMALLARWFETFWACRCAYYNIATYRCILCGSRPPRRLRAEVAALAAHEKPAGAPRARR